MLRLIAADLGQRCTFEGVDVLRPAAAADLRALRRRMSLVFQDPFGALNPRMRVRQILAEPFAIHGGAAGRGPGGATRVAPGGSGDGGVGAWRGTRMSFPAANGSAVNIARALALKPDLLVLDEPVSALDVSVGRAGD